MIQVRFECRNVSRGQLGSTFVEIDTLEDARWRRAAGNGLPDSAPKARNDQNEINDNEMKMVKAMSKARHQKDVAMTNSSLWRRTLSNFRSKRFARINQRISRAISPYFTDFHDYQMTHSTHSTWETHQRLLCAIEIRTTRAILCDLGAAVRNCETRYNAAVLPTQPALDRIGFRWVLGFPAGSPSAVLLVFIQRAFLILFALLRMFERYIHYTLNIFEFYSSSKTFQPCNETFEDFGFSV